MRLDKFLKVSRLIKRRTIANDATEQGRVLLNGNIAKPSKQVKIGDIITIVYANKETKYEIKEVPERNISIQEATNLYRNIE